MRSQRPVPAGLKRVQQWAHRRIVKLKRKLHDLNYFFWETTLRCNLACRHCGSDCAKEEKMPELSGARVLDVFRDIAAHYPADKIMVAVTGGEPLVREDLFEVMAGINRLGFRWGLVTNGMLVDEAVVEQCARTGMRTVVVSLDGLEESHNWLRNNPRSHERAVNALKLFVDAKKFSVVEAITCVNYRNIGELETMYQELRRMGVNSWRLFTVSPLGRAAQNADLIFTRDILEKLFEFIRRKRLEDPSWPVSYSEEGYLGPKWENEVRGFYHACNAGVNVGGLLCDGSYSACPSLSRRWIQGHLDELPFSEAWETRYQNMRDRRWMKNEFCGGCREWKNCEASSLHLWNWETGRPNVCHYRMLK